MTKVFPYGAMKVSHMEKCIFKVNEQQLKLYFGGNIEKAKTNIVFKPE